MPNKIIQCPTCKGSHTEENLHCPYCWWWTDLVEKTHTSKDSFVEFLYTIANNSCKGFLEEIEKVETLGGNPSQICQNWKNVWHKLFYLINLVIKTRSSGVLLFHYPNGKAMYRLKYVRGNFVVG